MPQIQKNIENLRPITDNQYNLFSLVTNTSIIEHDALVIPITKEQFFNEWNLYPIKYKIFYTFGDTLEQCKNRLRENTFARHELSYTDNIYEKIQSLTLSQYQKMKTVTWVRMIIAFNMYAEVRKAFHLNPYDKIDLIGSTGIKPNKYYNNCLNNNILYINDNTLDNIKTYTIYEKNRLFWDCIFDIYDNVVVGIRNNIEQEYINRKNDKKEMFMNNKQIANLIMKTEHQLPEELIQVICENCK